MGTTWASTVLMLAIRWPGPPPRQPGWVGRPTSGDASHRDGRALGAVSSLGVRLAAIVGWSAEPAAARWLAIGLATSLLGAAVAAPLVAPIALGAVVGAVHAQR